MMVFVKTLTGLTIEFEETKNTTIFEIKAKVQEKTGLSLWDQTLIYSGQRLADESSLEDISFSSGDSLHLILILRGSKNSQISNKFRK